MQPAALQYKLQEPILLLGKDRFADVDIRIRVKGGGHTSQIYAIRQALSKSLVAYYQKCKIDRSITKLGFQMSNSKHKKFPIYLIEPSFATLAWSHLTMNRVPEILNYNGRR